MLVAETLITYFVMEYPMAGIELDPLQLKAVEELHSGSILKGGVGSGKSRTSIAYFYLKEVGGKLKINGEGDFEIPTVNKDLLIFTTAKKRDDLDWQVTAAQFGLSTDPEISSGGIKVTVDSWQNIVNYTEVEDTFVIFDEQRLVGKGAWVKAFFKIAKNNNWIVLSATPGDNWSDYVPVFIANGLYKNRREFEDRHAIFSRYTKFPKIEGYREQGHLLKLREKVIVDMPYVSHTNRDVQTITVDHDAEMFRKAMKDRWHVYEERPVREVSELFQLMRKIVNLDDSRTDAIISLQSKHPRLIVFYNFNYELMKLRELAESLGVTYAEWNGHLHQPVPTTENWLYLVQYTAGAEAWECITTDAMVFYSLNYSYKIFEQAQGRIDRRNTPFTNLYYYVLRSSSWIDQAIWKAILFKKVFNESMYKL